MNYTIDTRDLDRLRKTYARFSDRRFKAGMATALTRTAGAGQQAQRAELVDVFDRPTARTLGAIYVQPATAARLEARFGIADQATSGRQVGAGRAPIKWLRWHIVGGLRSPKGFERRLMSAGAMPDDMRAVPGRFARLDPFGNLSAGQIRQILSQLSIELSTGATSALQRPSSAERRLVANARRGSGFVGPLSGTAVKNARARVNRAEAAYRRAGGQFIALPNGRGKLRPGIYQVRQFHSSWGRSAPRPILVFVTRAQYEAGRYDFDYVSQLAVQRHLQPNVDVALAEQLRRWGDKYGASV